VAHGLGFKTKSFLPQTQHWEDVNGKIGYKTRNLEIAQECNYLYCFTVPVQDTKCYHHDTPQDHEKTAGCWTVSKTLEMGKSCQLMILPSRENI